MYADRKLVEQLLFKTKIPNTKIAEIVNVQFNIHVPSFPS